MKKFLFILSLVALTSLTGFAQEDSLDNGQQGGKLLERMQLYIQKKLLLTNAEAEKFRPIFFRYIAELRRTHRENMGDRPMLQLRVAELRVRFRNEFRQIVDEPRANKIFQHQKEFEDKIRQEILDRRMNKQGGGGRRIKGVMGYR